MRKERQGLGYKEEVFDTFYLLGYDNALHNCIRCNLKPEVLTLRKYEENFGVRKIQLIGIKIKCPKCDKSVRINHSVNGSDVIERDTAKCLIKIWNIQRKDLTDSICLF
jgi:hypothetical protein